MGVVSMRKSKSDGDDGALGPGIPSAALVPPYTTRRAGTTTGAEGNLPSGAPRLRETRWARLSLGAAGPHGHDGAGAWISALAGASERRLGRGDDAWLTHSIGPSAGPSCCSRSRALGAAARR